MMTFNKQLAAEMYTRLFASIDWIKNIGPIAEDEVTLNDLEQSARLLARIVYRSRHNETCIYCMATLAHIDDEVRTIAKRNGADLTNIPQDGNNQNTNIPEVYYKLKGDRLPDIW